MPDFGRRPSLREYLESIKDVKLHEHVPVAEAFVRYAVGAHSWYKAFRQADDLLGFVFYLDSEPFTEIRDGAKEVYPQYKNFRYGIIGHQGFSPENRIPREIQDAGLVVVGSDYRTEQSRRIMVLRAHNVVEAVEFYRYRDGGLIAAEARKQSVAAEQVQRSPGPISKACVAKTEPRGLDLD